MSGQTYRWVRRGKPGTGASGADHRRRVMDVVGGAERMVVIASPLITDEEVGDLVREKGEEGVRFYIFTATPGRISRGAGTEFPDGSGRSHEEFQAGVAGHALIRQSEGAHARAVLADPFHKPGGLLLTMDVTKDGLDTRRGLMVDLDGRETEEAARIMRHVFWERAERERIGRDGAVPCSSLGAARETRGRAVLQTTLGHATIQESIDRMLEGGREKIIVSNPMWDPKSGMIERLCAMSEEGADVTVITKKTEEPTHPMERMRDAGISVVAFKRLHARAVATEHEAVVMSANMDGGIKDGFELGIRPDGDRAKGAIGELQKWAAMPEFELGTKSK